MPRTSRKKRRIAVTIVVAGSHQQKAVRIMKALRLAGLEGAKHQRALGTITGEIEDTEKGAKRRLGSIPGVEAIDIAQTYELPPADEDVQ